MCRLIVLFLKYDCILSKASSRPVNRLVGEGGISKTDSVWAKFVNNLPAPPGGNC